MELKQSSAILPFNKLVSINRTFMELKPAKAAREKAQAASINRTFMELKLATRTIFFIFWKY